MRYKVQVDADVLFIVNQIDFKGVSGAKVLDATIKGFQ